MPLNPASTAHIRPAQGAFAITASATALAKITRGIYVAVSGNITVTMATGESVTFTSIAAGVIHPIAATHVTAATATGILGLY
jgi:hypothetical protein